MDNILSRRRFLAVSGATTVGVGAATVLGTSISLAAPGVPADGDVLVSVHLAGGADGLSLTPPLRDNAYYDVRPTIAVPQPGQEDGSLALTGNGRVGFSSGFEGTFGLHPAARSLYDGLWAAGKLAILPGAGLKGSTLSHGTSTNFHRKGSLSYLVPGTWIGRMVTAQGGDASIPSTGVADAAGNFSAIGKIAGYKEGVPLQDRISKLYAGGTDLVSTTARSAIRLGVQVGALEPGAQPGYPEDNQFSASFSELAQLLKRSPSFGIRAASLSAGFWDHHDNLRNNFPPLLGQLADAVQAFAEDTNGLDGITLVITTEFGRAVNENGAKGADHGEALTMLVAGGGIRGGVYGDDYVDSLRLPDGAHRASLPIGTDYRKPISEIIRKRVRLADTSAVFPDYTAIGPDLGIV